MTIPQRPIQSGFNATSTATDVLAGIDLSGKTAIVTGCLGNGVRPWAFDSQAAQRLWKLSERLTGITFDA